MRKPPVQLNVYPNPYRTLDPDGQPAHAFPCDHKHAGSTAAYVGAKREVVVLAASKPLTITSKGRKPRTVTAVSPDRSKAYFVFEPGPVVIPDLPLYRRGIAEGDLVAADEATARRVGVRFEPPLDVLRREREAAARAYAKANDGEMPPWADEPATNTETAAAPAALN